MAPDELAYKPLGKYTPELNTPKVQQKDYNITKTEWVVDNREQTGGRGNIQQATANTSVTIFTVPSNRFFYLEAADMFYQIHTTGNRTFIIRLRTPENNIDIFFAEPEAVALISNHPTQNFSMPIRMPPNSTVVLEVLEVGTTGVVSATASINGYLETF